MESFSQKSFPGSRLRHTSWQLINCLKTCLQVVLGKFRSQLAQVAPSTCIHSCPSAAWRETDISDFFRASPFSTPPLITTSELVNSDTGFWYDLFFGSVHLFDIGNRQENFIIRPVRYELR